MSAKRPGYVWEGSDGEVTIRIEIPGPIITLFVNDRPVTARNYTAYYGVGNGGEIRIELEGAQRLMYVNKRLVASSDLAPSTAPVGSDAASEVRTVVATIKGDGAFFHGGCTVTYNNRAIPMSIRRGPRRILLSKASAYGNSLLFAGFGLFLLVAKFATWLIGIDAGMAGTIDMGIDVAQIVWMVIGLTTAFYYMKSVTFPAGTAAPAVDIAQLRSGA